jgi:hypothetical protein
MLEGKHLTLEGVKEIQKIKSRINKIRDFNKEEIG